MINQVEVTICGLDTPEIVKCRSGTMIKPDTDVACICNTSYGAVVIPGGLEGARLLSESKAFGNLLKDQEKSKGLIAAICAGSVLMFSPTSSKISLQIIFRLSLIIFFKIVLQGIYQYFLFSNELLEHFCNCDISFAACNGYFIFSGDRHMFYKFVFTIFLFLGPTVLKAHQICPGYNVTCYPSVADKMCAGNLYKYHDNRPVVKDKNLITSRGPATAMNFAFVILGELMGDQVAKEVGDAMLFDYCATKVMQRV